MSASATEHIARYASKGNMDVEMDLRWVLEAPGVLDFPAELSEGRADEVFPEPGSFTRGPAPVSPCSTSRAELARSSS